MNKKGQLLILIRQLQIDLRQRKASTLNTTMMISEMRKVLRDMRLEEAA
jgi:hypothetical protein